MAASGVQVLVQLGPLPPYVIPYLTQAAAMMPTYQSILITDQRPKVTPAGATIVSLVSLVSPAEIADLDAALVRGGFDLSFRHGYWRGVFLRFLCIRNYLVAHPTAGTALHLESDVASFVTPFIAEGIASRGSARAFVPMHDEQSACPSIMIGSSSADLAAAMDLVLNQVGSERDLSDMTILGRAVNGDLLERLPTVPAQSVQRVAASRVLADGSLAAAEEASVIFDAAAVGQYLFGIDPRNNRGVLIPGYRETRGGVDPGLWSDWHLASCEDGVTRVAVRVEGQLAVLALLHMHAKIALPALSLGSAAWADALAIANHERGAIATVQRRAYLRYEFEESVRVLRRQSRRRLNQLRGQSGGRS